MRRNDKDEDNVQEAVVKETKEKENIRTAKSAGEFDMLMSILDIDRFEIINKVQFNFFRSLSDVLIPVEFRKNCKKTFVMDILYSLIDQYNLIC